MRVRIDPGRCQGHSLCFMSAPDIFDITEDGKATPVKQPQNEAERAAVRHAAQSCPEQAIGWTE